MNTSTDSLTALDAAANQLDLVLEASQKHAILGYIEQIQRWNKTYNLTALRKAEQVLVQHVFDSLSVVRPIQAFLAGRSSEDSPTLVDVGAGAGLPGTLLAIMHPAWQVHCVDAVEKKMAFVRQMSGVLALPNLHAVHGRIEQLPEFGADVVVSRAFASLVDFVQLAGRHVAPDGVILAMKGRMPDDEIAEMHSAQSEWRVDHVQPLQVPQLDAQRCLVWIRRQGNP